MICSSLSTEQPAKDSFEAAMLKAKRKRKQARKARKKNKKKR